MRTGVFDKFGYGFILFLVLVFAGRELPELLSLADDVSNDGEATAVMTPQAQSSSIIWQSDKAAVPHSFDVFMVFHGFTSQNSPQLLHLQAGNDLLHLLSVQRE